MEHHFLDLYSLEKGALQKIDPRAKIITFFSFVIVVVQTPITHALSFYLYLLLPLILASVSRVPLGFLLKRSLLIIPFVLLVSIFIPFLGGAEVVGSYNLVFFDLSITKEGILIFLNILVKAWLSVFALTLLTATTRFQDLLGGFQKLRLPQTFVMVLSFLYRYLFVLEDEFMRMRRARDSRNFGGSWRWKIKTVGNMFGTLFIRAYERGERVYAAMLARGFSGEVKLIQELKFGRVDLQFSILFLTAILIMRLL